MGAFWHWQCPQLGDTRVCVAWQLCSSGISRMPITVSKSRWRLDPLLDLVIQCGRGVRVWVSWIRLRCCDNHVLICLVPSVILCISFPSFQAFLLRRGPQKKLRAFPTLLKPPTWLAAHAPATHTQVQGALSLPGASRGRGGDGCSFAAVIVSGRAGSRGLIPVCFVDLEGNGRAEQDKKPVALELCPQPPQVHG